jgi:hypothetical protein
MKEMVGRLICPILEIGSNARIDKVASSSWYVPAVTAFPMLSRVTSICKIARSLPVVYVNVHMKRRTYLLKAGNERAHSLSNFFPYRWPSSHGHVGRLAADLVHQASRLCCLSFLVPVGPVPCFTLAHTYHSRQTLTLRPLPCRSESLGSWGRRGRLKIGRTDGGQVRKEIQNEKREEMTRVKETGML